MSFVMLLLTLMPKVYALRKKSKRKGEEANTQHMETGLQVQQAMARAVHGATTRATARRSREQQVGESLMRGFFF
jgi:hypothetical protein